MGWALTTLKNELKENIATLLDLQSEHIQTRKESRVHHRNEDLEKAYRKDGEKSLRVYVAKAMAKSKQEMQSCGVDVGHRHFP